MITEEEQLQRDPNPKASSSQNAGELNLSNVLTITHKEIIEHLCERSKNDSLSLTDNCQKKFIFEFVCQKLGLKPAEILPDDLKELNQTIGFFFYRFLQKYRDPKISRKIKRVLSDPWASLCLSLPPHLANLLCDDDSSEENDSNWEEIADDKIPTTTKQSSQRPKGLIERKRKAFANKKRRAQLKVTSVIRATYSQEAIHLANRQNL